MFRNHLKLNERWVQDRIAEDPSMLGLGDVILKDRERIQPKAGRLDLLLQDAESNRRYEVEIQLGATDESHIIRTIEYWDIERKRYPQYEHTAVIVAEDITSRFLNVINLFNGVIPLIAIQMRAFQVDSKVGLVFTTVIDLLTLVWLMKMRIGSQQTEPIGNPEGLSRQLRWQISCSASPRSMTLILNSNITGFTSGLLGTGNPVIS